MAENNGIRILHVCTCGCLPEAIRVVPLPSSFRKTIFQNDHLCHYDCHYHDLYCRLDCTFHSLQAFPLYMGQVNSRPLWRLCESLRLGWISK